MIEHITLIYKLFKILSFPLLMYVNGHLMSLMVNVKLGSNNWNNYIDG